MKRGLSIFLIIILALASIALAQKKSIVPSGSAQRLSYTGSSDSYNGVFAMSGPYVHVAWKEGDFCFYRRNTNNGASGYWDPSKKMINSGELNPFDNAVAIAADGSYVHLVISRRASASEDYELYHRRSTDNGVTWSSWYRLIYNTGESERPVLACQSANVYLVWHDKNPGNAEIFFKRNTNNGATGSWSGPKRLSYSSAGSWYPHMTAAGAYVYIIWEDENPGNAEIFFKRNTNYGAPSSWSPPTRLTYNSGFSWLPRITCDNTRQNIQVVWSDDNPGNYEIFHKRNTNFGSLAAWSAATRICYSGFISTYPDISTNGSNVDIIWQDNNPGNYEIFVKSSINLGSIFGGVTRWTYNAGQSQEPKIDSATGAIIWTDNNPGNYEMFYRK